MKNQTFSKHSFYRLILGLSLLLSLLGAPQATASLAAAQSAPSAPDQSVQLPPGAGQDWWSAVQQDIQHSEYQVSWSEQTGLAGLAAAYQAPNRAQNLRSYFTDSGVRITPRQVEAGQSPAWELGLRLSAYGRTDALQAVGAALSHAAQGERFSYQYANLEEWYLNQPEGLEQGFTLAERPAGSGELALELCLGGGLTAHLLEDGQAIEFTTPGGVTVLRYDHLLAYDATGRALPARLSLSPLSLEGRGAGGEGQAIRILVDDAAAQYPLTVDPLATTPAWTAESNQAFAYFGASVATAGDVNGDGYADVIVGAFWYDSGQSNEGRAYVYHGSASGLSGTAAWTAESNSIDAEFGRSAATAGDVNGDGYADVIVGASYYSNGQSGEGAAYVYHGSASGLSTTAAWMVESNQANAEFGKSVATAGDVNGDGYADVIVGAVYYDNGQSDEGRAFVYHGSASGLSTTANWTAESNLGSAFFGISVATAGDVNGDGYADVIIGAYGYTNGQSGEGRAYVYYGSAGGLGSTPWTAESDQFDARLGQSVSTAGDVNGDGYADVIVGANMYDNGEADEGRAFVWLGSAAGVNGGVNGTPANAAWTTESNQASANFGWSVATAGDVNGDGYADVIVGANTYTNDQSSEGAAYVYHGSASGLSTTAAWMVESNQANAQFGRSVATAGDVNGDGYADVIVGAYYYTNGQSYEGRAYVYHGAAGGLSATAGWTAESNQASAGFGFSVATAGDVNGDGYADVIVGAIYYDNGQTDEGRAYVYYGSAGGLGSTPWTAESDQASASFGGTVATAGDVNGDGYADVIVAAYRYDNGLTDEGAAFVWYGSASGVNGGVAGTPANAAWTAESNQASAWFGTSVSTAGDVNGDGYADVIVGARQFDNSQTDEGRAFVYHGSAGGLSATANWTAESDQIDARLGVAVSTAGDVNGDGYADVIVGAYTYDNPESLEGAAFVWHGSASGVNGGTAGTPANAAWTAESNQVNATFGGNVATAGDVNGDGYADVIVGAQFFSNGEASEGRVWLYHGSAAGLSAAANWTAEGNQADARFFVGSTAGDVNGDGYADVIVGANFYDNGESNEGRASVYHGSASGLNGGVNGTPLNAAWTAESNQVNAYFGLSAATAGDVNGDGYADVIVGAYTYDNGEADEGRAFVYYGNGGDGLHLLPQARRANNTAPIQPGSISDSSNSFRLAALGRTPFGRGKVRLEWETKPLGTPFNGSGLSQGASWTDTGTAGAALNELATVLANSPTYHWRVRLLYHPVTTPFQQRSRWFTQPWNGWNESDLRLPCVLPTNTSFQTGNWSSRYSWNCGQVPAGGANVTVANGHTVTLDSARSVGSLTINGGLSVSGASALNVAGNWTNNGTFNHNNGAVHFNGTSTIGGSQISSFFDIFLEVASSVVAPGGTMNVAGNWTNNGTFSHNNGAVHFNGASTIGGSQISSFFDIFLEVASSVVAPGGTMNVAGNFTNNGTFTPGTGTVAFNGSGVQNIVGNTSFNNVTVASGVTLASNSLVTRGGWLANSGVTQETRAIGAAGLQSFGLAEITINVTTQGTLSTLVVERRDVNHPNATPSQQTGVWWQINPTGGGYTANLTLPYPVATANDRACRWDGALWDCAGGGGSGVVTRSGITAFSPWAVGDDNPTAVTVSRFNAVQRFGMTSLEWTAVLESQVLGYNLYSSLTPDGGEKIRLNANLIPARVLQGAQPPFDYTFTVPAQPGARFYWLEVIQVGGSDWHGPAEIINLLFNLFLPFLP